MELKTDLVPLRVKVRLGVVGGKKRMVYPHFNDLPGDVRADMDWSEFLDTYGTGWDYDQVGGYGKADAYNPERGVQFACTCIPREFADAALAKFPGDVEEIGEPAMQEFYEQRAHADQPEELADNERLQTIALKQQLGLALTQDDQDAMDPEKPARGLRRNPHRLWTDHKVELGVASLAARVEGQIA